MNRDILNSLPVREVANDTFAIIDVLQDKRKESAVVALFCAAQIVAERYRLEPQDVVHVANRIMSHARGKRPEFDGARLYVMSEDWDARR